MNVMEHMMIKIAITIVISRRLKPLERRAFGELFLLMFLINAAEAAAPLPE